MLCPVRIVCSTTLEPGRSHLTGAMAHAGKTVPDGAVGGADEDPSFVPQHIAWFPESRDGCDFIAIGSSRDVMSGRRGGSRRCWAGIGPRVAGPPAQMGPCCGAATCTGGETLEHIKGWNKGATESRYPLRGSMAP